MELKVQLHILYFPGGINSAAHALKLTQSTNSWLTTPNIFIHLLSLKLGTEKKNKAKQIR